MEEGSPMVPRGGAREYLTVKEVELLMETARTRGRYEHRDATMILLAFRRSGAEQHAGGLFQSSRDTSVCEVDLIPLPRTWSCRVPDVMNDHLRVPDLVHDQIFANRKS
jgi:hypothetical protein